VTFAHTPERPAGCASDLDLDELLAGDLDGQPKELALRGHLDGCARCRARFAAFSAVEPPPLAAPASVVAPASASWRRAPRWRWPVLGLLSGAAALAVLAIFHVGTPRPGERTKGGLGLTVFVKRAGGAVDTVTQEADLHAGDELRFALASSAPGHAVVLGLDAAPSVTIYAPDPAAASTAIPIDATGSITLPGSIVADATAGAERVVALVCAAATAPEALRARASAALAAANGRPENVTSLGSGCLEASVLLHKKPVAAASPSGP
jgi:hypothetical protein